MSLYCIWAVRSALEENRQQTPDGTALSAAAVWFIYAAPAIWELCQQNKTFDGKVAKPGAMFRDEEWRGFTEARWRTWSQRLIELQGRISSQETSRLVGQAQRAIGEVAER